MAVALFIIFFYKITEAIFSQSMCFMGQRKKGLSEKLKTKELLNFRKMHPECSQNKLQLILQVN